MSPRPLFIAINAVSGADRNDMPALITQKLREAGHSVTLFEIPSGTSLRESCAPLIQQALEADGIVVAAGGDGTVNGIAHLCYKAGVTLGIIPLGTFNYFARALEIPPGLESLAVLSEGTVREVSAGFVQEHLFLNNASFGLYPKIIRKREEATARFGRKRIIGALSALHSLFQKQKIFTVNLNTEGQKGIHRTSMVFVGNNSFQLENLGLEVGECTRQNRLAVVILKPMHHLQTARLLWRGIVKSLKSEPHLQQFCADRFEVDTTKKRLELVIDGEIITCSTPLVFKVEAKAIRVIAPVPAETA